MKCSICQSQISLKFKHSISSNVCPTCGSKPFSDEQSERLLEILSSEGFKKNETVDDVLSWIFENYTLSSKDLEKDNKQYETTAELEETVEVEEMQKQPEVSKKIEEQTPFMKRTGINISKLQEAVNKIKNEENKQQLLLTPEQIRLMTEQEQEVSDEDLEDEVDEHTLNMQKLKGISGSKRQMTGPFRR